MRTRRRWSGVGCLAVAPLAGGAVVQTESQALVPVPAPGGTIDLRLLTDQPDGVWVNGVSMEAALANTTHGSVRRSRARLAVAQPPADSEMCEFGSRLPQDLVTIVVTSSKRRSRAERSARAACLPNVVMIEGYAPFAAEADVPLADRAKFGNGTFAALSLGEIAIHLSHRRALEQCLRTPAADSNRTSAATGCLIMEDDFTLSGPRLSERWSASYATLLEQPEWHFLFVGRCQDSRCGHDDLRVSTRADLYRTPRRNVSMATKGWQLVSPMCLHAYMVSFEGASRMLTALSTCPGLCPADWAPAAMADTSALFTISPALFTQSTALRLQKDSGALYSKADEARGLKQLQGNTWRPAIVSECMQRDHVEDKLPESAHAPWLRAVGGRNAPLLNAAVQFAYLGYHAARSMAKSMANATANATAQSLGVHDHRAMAPRRPSLTACVGLEQKLSPSGSRALFVDSAWQPGAEAVDAQIQGCALQYVSSLKRTRKMCGHVKSGGDDLALRCPFQTAAASTSPQNVSAPLTRLHCVARVAGFVTNESRFVSPNSQMQRSTAEPRSVDEVRFQETEGWPRPSACAWRTGPRLNYRMRKDSHYRVGLLKMVNHKRGLEFRPVLKAGSTVLRHLLTCLQPDEWTLVHQSVAMPANYTALIVVREPIRRYTSALMEIIRRVFSGMCPDGPCERIRDHYFTSGTLDTADDLARHTSWYRHALRFYNGDVTADERQQAVRDLLAAAVTDTSCLLDYYASEHFMTQMQLSAQGTPLKPVQAAEKAVYLKLDEVGHDADKIAASPLLSTMGADNESMERVQVCTNYAHGLAHNNQQDGAMGVVMGESVADEAQEAASGFARLPHEDELYATLLQEHALLLSVCHVYAQDSFCLSAQYDLPAPCKELLNW